MINLTAENVLKKLRGCTSAKPFPFETLAKSLGVQEPMDARLLECVLNGMQRDVPATVNSCTITKRRKTRTVYWPTCAIRPVENYGRCAYPPQQMKEESRTDQAIKLAYDHILGNKGVPQTEIVSLVIGRGYSKSTAYRCVNSLVQRGVVTRKKRLLYAQEAA